MVAGLTADPKQCYALAMPVIAAVGIIGLGANPLRSPSPTPRSDP